MPRNSSLAQIEPSVEWSVDDIAEAFAEKHKADFRYIPDERSWFTWEPDITGYSYDASGARGKWLYDGRLTIHNTVRQLCRSFGLSPTPQMVGNVERMVRSDPRLVRARRTGGSSPSFIEMRDGKSVATGLYFR